MAIFLALVGLFILWINEKLSDATADENIKKEKEFKKSLREADIEKYGEWLREYYEKNNI